MVASQLADVSDLKSFGRCHMFYDRRVVDIPDGKPKWTGLNNQSDLIEDSPPDLKRKREKEDKS